MITATVFVHLSLGCKLVTTGVTKNEDKRSRYTPTCQGQIHSGQRVVPCRQARGYRLSTSSTKSSGARLSGRRHKVTYSRPCKTVMSLRGGVFFPQFSGEDKDLKIVIKRVCGGSMNTHCERSCQRSRHSWTPITHLTCDVKFCSLEHGVRVYARFRDILPRGPYKESKTRDTGSIIVFDHLFNLLFRASCRDYIGRYCV